MAVSSHLRSLADRVRKEREIQKLTQREMARRAQMSLRSYQDFESTGNIALKKLATVLYVLGRENDLSGLVSAQPSYSSLDEFEKRIGVKPRSDLPVKVTSEGVKFVMA
jgi:transcriptional regulator with XRE-family HTH domain